MALENLEPVTRMESILNGDSIEPVTREEYFWQQAATSGSGGLPEYTAADVGKVLTVGGETPIWSPVVKYALVDDEQGGYMLFNISDISLGPQPVVMGELYQKFMPAVNATTGEIFCPTVSTSTERGTTYYDVVAGWDIVNPNNNTMKHVNVRARTTGLNDVIPTFTVTETLYTLTPSV